MPLRGPDTAPPFFFPLGVAGEYPAAQCRAPSVKNVDTTTRKPMLLLRLCGWFLLRLAQRALSAWLLYAPPRRTQA